MYVVYTKILTHTHTRTYTHIKIRQFDITKKYIKKNKEELSENPKPSNRQRVDTEKTLHTARKNGVGDIGSERKYQK